MTLNSPCAMCACAMCMCFIIIKTLALDYRPKIFCHYTHCCRSEFKCTNKTWITIKCLPLPVALQLTQREREGKRVRVCLVRCLVILLCNWENHDRPDNTRLLTGAFNTFIYPKNQERYCARALFAAFLFPLHGVTFKMHYYHSISVWCSDNDALHIVFNRVDGEMRYR